MPISTTPDIKDVEHFEVMAHNLYCLAFTWLYIPNAESPQLFQGSCSSARVFSFQELLISDDYRLFMIHG